MTLSLANAALLIIDVQQGFEDPFWGRRNNPEAEDNIVRLLQAWRARNWPVIHVQHRSQLADSPLNPSMPGYALKEEVQPLAGETLITKQVNSAFIGTRLEELLRQQEITTLAIVGLMTNHCVETTTRMAGNLGFLTYLVGDATATFDRVGPDGKLYRAEDIHAISLASIHEEFAQVVTTEEVLIAAQVEQ
ncbi:cysteine hydrolase family protein [Dictyobacter formicarum]|uniref:Isochorismatase n=1 Tax=Dictyobacter formicarum TaxID=2778368 RepID=A0ABQ3VJB9_9CHLR|nr:cysteine hydrolase family protein [Dictyobacter formicarum]GHO85774.1 isochorismatase [Dictyobacter formicarum]